MAANNSGSAAAKRLAEKKAEQGARTDSGARTGFGKSGFGAGRTSSKSGLKGFGMTKSGVEQRANSAWRDKFSEGFSEGLFDFDRYSNLTKSIAVGGAERQPYKKTERDSVAAANRVRSRYGMKPKNQADQDFSLRKEANYSEQPRRRAGDIDAEASIRRYAPGYGSKRFSDRY